ncbi:MAG TPA: APC family permease [Chitinophagaceae bacterium]|nr:APC family permease [Chitinophagaceae bacterium]
MAQHENGLVRSLNLPQATVLNMIDMVGIGPFITLPVILIAFPGRFSLIPWIIGAIVSLADGFVWGELGAAWPEAGGSYVFLQKLYKGRTGRIMSFLYVVQTSLHLPLVMTSAAIGFVDYAGYIVPLGFWEGKLVMVGLVVIVVFLLYRGITHVSRIGIVLSVVVVGLLLWTIVTGGMAYQASLFHANSVLPEKLHDFNSMAFWFITGNYTSKTIYAYLGYYNVCNLGSEIKKPSRNIPWSIIISVTGIAVFYVLMQWMVAGSVSQAKITNENVPVISILFEQVYGRGVAEIATVILLVVAGSSLFALLLGYSRIVYAAARDGMHFKVFAHLHPTKHFPDYTLLIFGAIAIVFCLLFSRPSAVFGFIVVTRIFIQFVPQAIGVMLLRIKKRTAELTFRMPLYPVIPIFSVLIWTFVFVTSGYQYFSSGIAIIIIGLVLYFLFFNRKDRKGLPGKL